MEQWRDVPGFDGYQASNLGMVRSVRNRYGNRNTYHYLSTKTSKYAGVNLRRDGKSTLKKIAYIVLITFVGPRPPGAVIRHLNDIKSDNRLCNLAYGTIVENVQDSVRNGRRGLSKDSVISLRNEYSSGEVTIKELATKYGISLSGVSLIVNNKRHVDI